MRRPSASADIARRRGRRPRPSGGSHHRRRPRARPRPPTGPAGDRGQPGLGVQGHPGAIDDVDRDERAGETARTRRAGRASRRPDPTMSARSGSATRCTVPSVRSRTRVRQAMLTAGLDGQVPSVGAPGELGGPGEPEARVRIDRSQDAPGAVHVRRADARQTPRSARAGASTRNSTTALRPASRVARRMTASDVADGRRTTSGRHRSRESVDRTPSSDPTRTSRRGTDRRERLGREDPGSATGRHRAARPRAADRRVARRRGSGPSATTFPAGLGRRRSPRRGTAAAPTAGPRAPSVVAATPDDRRPARRGPGADRSYPSSTPPCRMTSSGGDSWREEGEAGIVRMTASRRTYRAGGRRVLRSRPTSRRTP